MSLGRSKQWNGPGEKNRIRKKKKKIGLRNTRVDDDDVYDIYFHLFFFFLLFTFQHTDTRSVCGEQKKQKRKKKNRSYLCCEWEFGKVG